MSESNRSAVIFDLDGTLLDSLADISEAVNNVLIDFGFPLHSLQSYKHMVGDGISNLVNKAIPKEYRSEKLISVLVKEVLNKYNEFNYRNTTLYNGISELLNDLTGMNIRMAILSNKNDIHTKQVVSKTLSKWSFNPVIGATSKETLKPSPVNAILIAETWSLPPEKVIFIGDSETDILAAKHAKMISVAVCWGYRTKEKLQTFNPDFIIEKPEELIRIIDNT